MTLFSKPTYSPPDIYPDISAPTTDIAIIDFEFKTDMPGDYLPWSVSIFYHNKYLFNFSFLRINEKLHNN